MKSVFIQLMHTNSSETAATNVAKIHVQLSGTNVDSFYNVSDISINTVTAPTTAPTITQFTVDNVIGGATLNLQCSQIGTIYFALST